MFALMAHANFNVKFMTNMHTNTYTICVCVCVYKIEHSILSDTLTLKHISNPATVV